jgi:uncharacterized short protein YbdD (DUF466 family)
LSNHRDDKPNSLMPINPSKCAARLWVWLRQVTGDAAYDNYLQSIQRDIPVSTGAKPPLTREQFYLDALQRRYSTVSRCC